MMGGMFGDVVEQLGNLDHTDLDASIRTLELQRRALDAQLAAAVTAAEQSLLFTVDGHHSMKGYLRATCNWSNTDVARFRRLATLLDDLPSVGEALLAGRIGIAQATELARERANPRCGDQLGDIITVLVEHGEVLSFDEFRVCVRRWETPADLDGTYHDIGVEGRTAHIVEIDGTLDLRASGGDPLTIAELIGIHQHFIELEHRADIETRRNLNTANKPGQHPLPRTATQRRFDALVAICRAAIAAPANTNPPEPVVNILIDAATLDDTLTRHHLTPHPNADVDVDPALIDELATDPADLANR